MPVIVFLAILVTVSISYLVINFISKILHLKWWAKYPMGAVMVLFFVLWFYAILGLYKQGLLK